MQMGHLASFPSLKHSLLGRSRLWQLIPPPHVHAMQQLLLFPFLLQDSNAMQVWHLASLPSLKRVLLADPDWGSCPVAGLCNYATYAAVNLPQLHALDSQPLPAPAKALAQATYLKKKMYYNMRIHTLRRKAAILAHQARQGLQVRLLNLLLQQLWACISGALVRFPCI